MRLENDMQNNGKDLRISRLLRRMYWVFLALSVLIIGKIIIIQTGWEPDEDLLVHFQPRKYEVKEAPERGAILDRNGNLLAISTPMYNIYMDCTVRVEEFKGKKKGDSLENDWMSKADKLSQALPEVLAKDGKDRSFYYNLIKEKRHSKSGTYVPITTNIDHSTYLELRSLPLFNEGQYKGGMIKEDVEKRQNPYGSLAARVIGDVRIRKDDPSASRYRGLEGQYDYILRGSEGSKWMRRSDNGSIVDPDSTIVEAVDGTDIRTTLDIRIQEIADKALRKNIESDPEIEGGCVVVLDVKTGGVRAMVNLLKDSNGNLGEIYNLAIGRSGEPGSVFKTATLMTLLEEGKTTLSTVMPTNGGKMADFPRLSACEETRRYERNTGKKTITVEDGLKVSSNYVFRRLVADNYLDCPDEFIDKLYEYNLHDAYSFDVTEVAESKPELPEPDPKMGKYDLVSAAIGYNVKETPLNIVTFYNAIANNGKMVKPHLIESFEKDGKVVRKHEPEILNGSICSKATADSLTRALTMVTLEGTAATRLKNARCVVAGKTGTARVVLGVDDNPKKGDPYVSVDGLRRYQATFVGFFPADEPQYTAIVVLYSGLRKSSIGGGNLPALTYKEIVDNVWSMDSSWGETYRSRAGVPEMRPQYIATTQGSSVPVPDLKGMGLSDAMFAAENNGYRLEFEGVGHVASQTPAPGKTYKKGETIKVVLK